MAKRWKKVSRYSRDAKHARRITYVIDERGTIRHALANVDPATHIAEVLALVS